MMTNPRKSEMRGSLGPASGIIRRFNGQVPTMRGIPLIPSTEAEIMSARMTEASIPITPRTDRGPELRPGVKW